MVQLGGRDIMFRWWVVWELRLLNGTLEEGCIGILGGHTKACFFENALFRLHGKGLWVRFLGVGLLVHD